jgi:transposase
VKQFDADSMPYIVMDWAFYTKENVKESGEFRWATRVPETLKAVKELYQQIETESMAVLAAGYRYQAIGSIYGKTKQRWLIIYSEQAYQREIKTFE